MITKFERKVIAGLTAFLMCLSMVLAVPVSVNAEAEQTQDEAVSGAKQEEIFTKKRNIIMLYLLAEMQMVFQDMHIAGELVK